MNLQESTPEEMDHQLRIAVEAVEKYGNWDLLETWNIDNLRRLRGYAAMKEQATSWRDECILEGHEKRVAVTVADNILYAGKEAEESHA